MDSVTPPEKPNQTPPFRYSRCNFVTSRSADKEHDRLHPVGHLRRAKEHRSQATDVTNASH